MRIPRSAIVMTVVLAVPAALAIRDTWSDSGSRPKSARELARADREEMEQQWAREAEQAHAAERARAAAAEHKKVVGEQQLAKVIGAQPAQLGPLFDGVALGAPASEDEPAAVAAAEREGKLSVRFDADANGLEAIDVSITGIDGFACARQLEAAWGVRRGVGAWLDPTGHQRAVLDGSADACTLRFERVLPVAEWVAMLPLAVIGSPVKKLAIDKTAFVSDEELDWHAPGVGAGRGSTSITLSIASGKVVAASVAAETDTDTLEAIRAALSARLGAQPTAGASYRDPTYTWKAKPRVVLATWGERFGLEIGGAR